ncbi:hypothetical protein YSY43_12640 [Paenibacillus sp. YSY-4.3]
MEERQTAGETTKKSIASKNTLLGNEQKQKTSSQAESEHFKFTNSNPSACCRGSAAFLREQRDVECELKRRTDREAKQDAASALKETTEGRL